jgi:ABC-type branched-subunit amino acid transport system substrate-binding protein
MKEWRSIAAIAVLSLALATGVACGGEEEDGVKEVKLGFATALSGFLGTVVGIPSMQGIELANDMIGEFTVAGEKYRWKLLFEDNMWTASGGVTTATKFIYEDGVKFMVQSGDAGMAAQSICEEAGVLMLIASAGTGPFGPDKPHTFQLAASELLHAPAFFKWFTEQRPGVRTVAMADTDDTPGHSRMECQVPAAQHFGLEVLCEDFTAAGTVEFYPQATKIIALEPDFLVGSALLLVPMQEMGYQGLSTFCLVTTGNAEYVGIENYQGHLCYLPLPFAEGVPQAVKEMAEEYEARYGVPYELTSLSSAMDLYVMTEALKKAGTMDDVDRIIEVLETETFDTPIGLLRLGGEELIGNNHMLLWPVWINEFRGDEWRIVAQFTGDEAEAIAEEALLK